MKLRLLEPLVCKYTFDSPTGPLTGYCLQWRLDDNLMDLAVKAAPSATILSTDGFTRSNDISGLFSFMISRIDLDMCLNRIPNTIESLEELQKFTNLEKYRELCVSNPYVDEEGYEGVLTLIDQWLKYKKANDL